MFFFYVKRGSISPAELNNLQTNTPLSYNLDKYTICASEVNVKHP